MLLELERDIGEKALLSDVKTAFREIPDLIKLLSSQVFLQLAPAGDK